MRYNKLFGFLPVPAVLGRLSLKIQLNGQERDTEAGATLAQLIAGLELGEVRVAVERNFEIVPRAGYGSTVLAEGDRVEVVTLVGGG